MLSIGNTFLIKSKVFTHKAIKRVLYYLDDTHVLASNIIDKYENWPDNLHSMC